MQTASGACRWLMTGKMAGAPSACRARDRRPRRCGGYEFGLYMNRSCSLGPHAPDPSVRQRPGGLRGSTPASGEGSRSVAIQCGLRGTRPPARARRRWAQIQPSLLAQPG